MNEKPRIFISYVREDYELVKPLYQLLKAEGFDPWLDTTGLPPGVQWERTIFEEILKADFFLACHSTRSQHKLNSFQEREIELAFQLWETGKKDLRQTYFIPVRFDECQLSATLRAFQWVDQFHPNGVGLLVQTIRKEVARWHALLAAYSSPAAPQAVFAVEMWQTLAQADKLFPIVYAVTQKYAGQAYWVENLRDWTWRASAQLRWLDVGAEAPAAWLQDAKLLVLDWSLDEGFVAEDLALQMREVRPDLPLLLVIPERQRGQTCDLMVSHLTAHPTAAPVRIITAEELDDSAQIATAFQKLGLTLPPVMLQLHQDGVVEVSEAFDGLQTKLQVEFSLQKFFPWAARANLLAVNKSNQLCQIFVDGQGYFFQFFAKREQALNELKRQAEASKWLGDAALRLRPIPLGTAWGEAFPFEESGCFPVCYEPISIDTRSFLSLKDCYRNETDELVGVALMRLLETLAQPGAATQHDLPWGVAPFERTPELKQGVLAALESLALYGQRLYGRGTTDDEAKWKGCADAAQQLFDGKLPAWLTTPKPLKLGHIHGALVSDNCLINLAKPDEIRLIGCGGYEAQGRLVSDLARLECDLKLSLMNTEKRAPGLLDLEVKQLREWCKVEDAAIRQGLGYNAGSPLTSFEAIKRAYSLIGQVRQKANQISADEGEHYFAALLYWTLASLKLASMHPTKKLLALHSAGQILRETWRKKK